MKKRILVIEDEREIALILKMRLEANGYEVLEAFDGKDGLESAKSWSPDLILLDLVLPKMAGTQILNVLKGSDRYKHIPIIVVTGLTLDTESIKSCVAKADSYFLKPFDSTELMATIADFLQNPPKNS